MGQEPESWTDADVVILRNLIVQFLRVLTVLQLQVRLQLQCCSAYLKWITDQSLLASLSMSTSLTISEMGIMRKVKPSHGRDHPVLAVVDHVAGIGGIHGMRGGERGTSLPHGSHKI
jgi:hypothetical protein